MSGLLPFVREFLPPGTRSTGIKKYPILSLEKQLNNLKKGLGKICLN